MNAGDERSVTEHQIDEICRIAAAVDHFSVLGIARASISPDEVKRRYRAIAILVHPDKCHLDGSEAAFKKLGAAYEQLCDPSRLAIYLRSLFPSAESVRPKKRETSELTRDMKRARREKERKLQEERLEVLRDEIEGRLEANYSAWSRFRNQEQTKSKQFSQGSPSSSAGAIVGPPRGQPYVPAGAWREADPVPGVLATSPRGHGGHNLGNFSCVCCRVSFDSAEELRTHQNSDFHSVNSELFA